MGPFRRRKSDDPADRPPDLAVREAVYRRLGRAMATVVVTVDTAPPGDTRLRIRTGSSSLTVDPVMITHESPGTPADAHRLWYATELSAVMFADGEFALAVGEGDVAVPLPVPATDANDDESSAWSAARIESELRAAVAALEARCRALESANAELTADARRMADVVAATLAEVRRERDQLLDLVARTGADADADPEADGPQPEHEPKAPSHYPNRELLARLGAARGAAGTEDRPA